MSKLHTTLTMLTLGFVATACGGGGGGGSGNGSLGELPACDPGDFRPEIPAGLGIAGSMEGVWRVVTSDLVADPRTRDPKPDGGWINVDDQVEFRDGIVYFDTSAATGAEPTTSAQNTSNTPTFEGEFEFYCNENSNSITLYGFGFTMRSTISSFQATLRLGAIFGTTGATTAQCVIIEQTVVSGTPNAEDRFMVRQLSLEKVQGTGGGSLPAHVGPGGSGQTESVGRAPSDADATIAVATPLATKPR